MTKKKKSTKSKIVGKIKRKPKMFYYVDSNGNVREMKPKRR